MLPLRLTLSVPRLLAVSRPPASAQETATTRTDRSSGQPRPGAAEGELAIRALSPEPGEEEALEVGRIRIELLRLSHGTGRFASIQNLGHVVTVGGVTALHVGDAEMLAASFAPYRLGERGIDVAFVPYWYFDDPTGRRIVDEHFRPAKLVACHVPPRELEDVTRRLARSDPDVLVPQEAFEVFRVRDENRR